MCASAGWRWALVLPALWGLSVAGCGGFSASPDGGATNVPDCAADSPARKADAVRVRVIDAEGFAQVLKQHRGEVVLVDFWATWCGPCCAGFPHTVELHRRLGGRGLAVFSVSIDDPRDKDAVLGFLTQQAADFQNFISHYGNGTDSFEAFNLGPLPQYDLYDREGRLVRSFGSGAGRTDPRELDCAVEELLKR